MSTGYPRFEYLLNEEKEYKMMTPRKKTFGWISKCLGLRSSTRPMVTKKTPTRASFGASRGSPLYLIARRVHLVVITFDLFLFFGFGGH